MDCLSEPSFDRTLAMSRETFVHVSSKPESETEAMSDCSATESLTSDWAADCLAAPLSPMTFIDELSEGAQQNFVHDASDSDSDSESKSSSSETMRSCSSDCLASPFSPITDETQSLRELQDEFLESMASTIEVGSSPFSPITFSDELSGCGGDRPFSPATRKRLPPVPFFSDPESPETPVKKCRRRINISGVAARPCLLEASCMENDDKENQDPRDVSLFWNDQEDDKENQRPISLANLDTRVATPRPTSRQVLGTLSPLRI